MRLRRWSCYLSSVTEFPASCIVHLHRLRNAVCGRTMKENETKVAKVNKIKAIQEKSLSQNHQYPILHNIHIYVIKL